MMIPTTRNDPTGPKAQEKSPFPADMPRKSMENGNSTSGRQVAELSGDFRPFPNGKNTNLTGKHRKIRNIPGPEYCFDEIPGIYRSQSFLAVLSSLVTASMLILPSYSFTF
jgi:hypothetical protein